MANTYKYFRWLSLDIVLGAVFFLFFLERYYRVDISISVYFGLASAIWLIYTCDHLIDAKKVLKPSSARHRYHQVHFNELTLIGGLVLIAALVNVYYLPEKIIKSGALLSACCIAYLMLVFFFQKLWVKELLVAMVYATGIFLAPLTLKLQLTLPDLILVFQLSLIAFLNLMVFSFYDAKRDTQDGFNSLVLRLGLKPASRLIHLIALVSILLSLLMNRQHADIQVLFLMMIILLYSLHLLPKVFAANDRFRTVGDGVFFLPAVFLLLYL